MKKLLIISIMLLMLTACNKKTSYHYTIDSDTTNWYISFHGCDTNHGHHPDYPLRTWTELHRRIMYPGDTVFLKEGDRFVLATIKDFPIRMPDVIEADNDIRWNLSSLHRYFDIIGYDSNRVYIVSWNIYETESKDTIIQDFIDEYGRYHHKKSTWKIVEVSDSTHEKRFSNRDNAFDFHKKIMSAKEHQWRSTRTFDRIGNIKIDSLYL